MLQTKRLTLRQWKDDDFLSFAKMCNDKDVMEYFPKFLTKNESIEMAKAMQLLIDQRGWGLWAVEITDQQQFVGVVGLHIPTSKLPFSPCVEIGWRLSKHYWGNGYATEAAKKALEFAFTTLKLEEVVSFTAVVNERSQSVMKKIGMQNTHRNFMHPDIDSANSLCEHVLYTIDKSQWQKQLSER